MADHHEERASPGDTLFAISGRLMPTRVTPAYRVGLVVVAAAMVLLPIAYLALMAGAAALVWWHVTTNTWLLEGGGLLRLIVYAGPAIAGGVLLFFMVKPVLARASGQPHGIEIDRESEPRLFGFIEDICRQVRAPVPSSVRVDCQVNASASFAGGVLKGRKGLVLTIGLPLAAGLTIRELGGVLAHEFGHFAQGSGMRLTMIVRGINNWFAQVVYGRDRWDVTLERLAQASDVRIAVVLHLARGSVWVTRKTLLGLMMAGHAISCFMLRQMEYDADSYEIKFAGSAAFVATMNRVRDLSLGARASYADLRNGWSHGSLPANFPAFLVTRAANIPGDVLNEARAHSSGATGWFDTHPADADRVRAAEQAACAGVLVDGGHPAIALFRDFDAIGLAATRDHYEQDLGLTLESAHLLETTQALDESQRHEEGLQSLTAFFGDRLSPFRPLRIVPPAASAADLEPQWQTAVQAMRNVRTNIGKTYRYLETFELRRDRLMVARALMNGGFTAVNDEDGGRFDTYDSLRVADEDVAGKLKALASAVAPFEAAAARRLSCCLGMLDLLPIDDAARSRLAAEAVSLAEALGTLVAVWEPLGQVRRTAAVIDQLLANRTNSPHPEQVDAVVRDRAATIGRLLSQARSRLADAPCPRPDGRPAPLMRTAIGLTDDDQAIRPTEIVERAVAVYFRLLGRLSSIAIQVEAALGREGGRPQQGGGGGNLVSLP